MIRKDFKSVTLVFENCEKIVIPTSDIRFLYVGNLKQNIINKI